MPRFKADPQIDVKRDACARCGGRVKLRMMQERFAWGCNGTTWLRP